MPQKLDWLQRIYLGIVAPATVALVFLIPPLEAPDERAHILRADAISHGALLSVMLGPEEHRSGIGGMVDTSLREWMDRLNPSTSSTPILKLSRQGFLATMEVVDRENLEEASFPNTSLYPPLLYLHTGLSIALARAVGLPVWTWLYAARLANVLVAIAIIAALMRNTPPSMRAAILILSALPIMIYQLATASTDALLLPVALGFACLVARYFTARPVAMAESIALAAASIVICVGKFAYLPFALLPPFAARAADGYWSRRAQVLAGISLLTVVLWGGWTWFIHDKVLPMQPDVAVSPSDQLNWMAGHVIMAFKIFVRSVLQDAHWVTQTMVGSHLANLSLIVSKRAVASSLLILGIALMTVPDGIQAPRWFRMLVAGVCISIFWIVWLLLYLQFNAVGHWRVEGVQGRYFLPLVFLIFLFFPKPLGMRFNSVVPWIAGPYAMSMSLYLIFEVCRSFWTV